MAQYCKLLYFTVQFSTVQYTVQYIEVLYSTISNLKSDLHSLGLVPASTIPRACTERLVCQLVDPFADKHSRRVSKSTKPFP